MPVFYLSQTLYVHIMISMVRVCQRSINVWCLWSWQQSVAGYRTWSMNNKEVGQFGRPTHSSTFTFRRPSHFIDSINWDWTFKPPNKKTERHFGMLLHFQVVWQPFEGSENVNTSTFFHYICQGHERDGICQISWEFLESFLWFSEIISRASFALLSSEWSL